MKNAKEAVKNLGERGKFRARFISDSKILVEKNGKYYGIFDTNKNTFVD